MSRFHAQIVRALLRCYPRAWRERYGEEFVALLAELPPSASQTYDLARGAFDAHRRSWKERAMSTIDMRPLDGDERRFWLRWVMQLLIAGVLIGVINRFVPLTLWLSGIFAADQRAIANELASLPLGLSSGQWRGLLSELRELAAMPLLGLVALGLGLLQWRALRTLLPELTRLWVALTLIGPLLALTIMTTDRSYSRFTDFISMTQYFSNLIGLTTGMVESRSPNLLTLLLPATTFGMIAATFQAFALKGVVNGAGWWIGVAMVAAIAGLGAARLFVPLRTDDYRIGPELIRPDLFLLDTSVFILQLGATCAAYGIVSGLGLLALHRLRPAQALTPAAA